MHPPPMRVYWQKGCILLDCTGGWTDDYAIPEVFACCRSMHILYRPKEIPKMEQGGLDSCFIRSDGRYGLATALSLSTAATAYGNA